MSSCAPEEVLVEFVAGRLHGQALSSLHEHLDACTTCRLLVVALITAVPHGTSPPPRRPAAEPPVAPLDEFRLVRPLGRGASGQVYLAHDLLLDRPVAIKWLSAVDPDDSARARFLQEARAIARLKHPNVVAVYRVGQVGARRYLVSEFVSGKSLDQLHGPRPLPEVLPIALGLCQALAAAHLRGVLHRDIKPANVMISDEGEVKLLDFGLAKLQDDDALSAQASDAQRASGAHPLTLTLGLLGTPLYMAPEVWRGEPATQRSDLYALGALLYQLCSGAPPWQGCATLAALRQAVVEQDARPLRAAAPHCDPRLASLVDRCLRRRPEERFACADELRRELEQIPVCDGGARDAGDNPYRGLLPFEAEHRALFFGRSAEIQAVLELLRGEPRVVVAGDSGIGKSSLCRAGVLPLCSAGALASGRTFALAVMVPGRQPLAALARALGPFLPPEHREALPEALGQVLAQHLGPTRGLVLFVDQLEELLTQSQPDQAIAAARALAQLSAGGAALRLLMTVRGDHLTRLAALPGLGDDLTRGLYILGPLSAEGLREAIVGPAQRRAVAFESQDLVQELWMSASRAAGGLPLLQFALAELWQARDPQRQVIPAAALAAIGGVSGALARHGDDVLSRLLPAQRAAARRLLLRLVTPDGARVRRAEAELLRDAADEVALPALLHGRLLTARQDDTGGPAYEIAHEALVRGWQTLRDWLDASVSARAALQRLESAAAAWERLGRPGEALWSLRQLQLEGTLLLATEELSPREAAFIAASQRRAAGRRLRQVALAVLGVAALGAAGAQHQRGQQEQRRAQELTEAERGARAASLARQPGMEVEALWAGVQAVAPAVAAQRTPPRLALAGLAAAVGAGRRSLPLQGHSRSLWLAAFSPDGRRVVTVSQDQTARLWDADTGALRAVLSGHGHTVGRAAFSPDGRRIVTASFDGAARLWDGHSGALLTTLLGHSEGIYEAAFSPDGGRVVTASLDGTARLWSLSGDPPAARVLAVLRGHRSSLLTCAFSPDGRRVLTGSADHSARLWDGHSGAPLQTLSGHLGAVTAVFSPDGERIATASNDATARLWDARTGQHLATLRGHSKPVLRAAFSPDGARLATASNDATARLWDARTGQALLTIQGHAAHVYSAAFSPDGTRLVTASHDHSARVWDLRTGQHLATLAGHRGPVFLAVFAPDGSRILTASQDTTARLWGGWSEQRLNLLQAHQAQVAHVAFSPDGGRIVTASTDTTARLWDGHKGTHIFTLKGHRDKVSSAVFSADGERVVTSSDDRTARLWDGRSGSALLTLAGHQHEVWHAVFSPDGQRIATGSKDGTGRLWDARTGATVAVLAGHTDAVRRLAFAADGRRLVTASNDRTARLWDARTGQALAVLRGHSDWLRSASFSPDGARVLTVSYDRTARLWDARTGQPMVVLGGHEAELEVGAFSGDSARILTAGHDGTARLWDARTGLALGVLRHSGVVRTAAFSPDSARVVTGGTDGVARLWDGRSLELVATLTGHGNAVNHLAFSDDGARLVTGSDDNSARLWDGRSGQPLPMAGAPEDMEEQPTTAAGRDAAEELLSSACALLRHQPAEPGLRSSCPERMPLTGYAPSH